MPASNRTHYDTLGVSEDASSDDVRKAYKEACLAFHPDKQRPGSGCQEVAAAAAALTAAQEAWAVLGDEAARKQYDEARGRGQGTRVVTDTFDEAELEEDYEDGWVGTDCRCGGRFAVSRHELLCEPVVVPCDTCSLAIRIAPEKS